MDFESIVQQFREDLSLDDEFSIQKAIGRLEAIVTEKCASQEEYKQALWIYLVRVSVELQNLKLAKIILQKLNLNDLLTTLDYIEGKRSCKSSNFSLLISYFNFANIPESTNSLKSVSIHEQNSKSIKTFNLSRQLELGEDYDRALEAHEQCHTHLDHCVRIILKNSMHLSYNRLKSYLQRDDNSKFLLANLAYNFGDFEYAIDLFKSVGDLAAVARSTAAMSGPQSAEACIFNGPLGRLDAFDLSENTTVPELNRTLQSLTVFASSISKQQRKALFELAAIYHTSENLDRACSIYLSLGLVDQVLRLPHKRLKRSKLFRLLWRTSDSSARALYYMVDQSTRQATNSGQHSKKEANKPFLFLRLGMFNEVLQAICYMDSGDASIYALDVIETLRVIIRKRDYESFINTDVRITESILRKLSASLSEDRMLNTNAIIIIMLCTTLYLIKIQNYGTIGADLNRELSMLETIFEYLSNLIELLKFNATELLTSSTNSLINAVKERLDIINDSDIIREAFKCIVDNISHECMVDGQYKSAAMLYASIDDNIKAVKSLMRTGEVDIVVNFSLLVKDIAVNRITINYLRHCGVDMSVIEDFITRCKR